MYLPRKKSFATLVLSSWQSLLRTSTTGMARCKPSASETINVAWHWWCDNCDHDYILDRRLQWLGSDAASVGGGWCIRGSMSRERFTSLSCPNDHVTEREIPRPAHVDPQSCIWDICGFIRSAVLDHAVDRLLDSWFRWSDSDGRATIFCCTYPFSSLA